MKYVKFASNNKLANILIVILGAALIFGLTTVVRKELFWNLKAAGNTYYVSPTGSDSGAGTIDDPWQTAGKATATATAGDTVYFREGTYYNQRIQPSYNGTAGNPITFAAYPGETALFSATGSPGDPIIPLYSRQYITIDGLSLDGNWERRWATVEDSNNIIIKNTNMVNAGTNYGLKFGNSSYNQILNNSFIGQGGNTDGVSDTLNIYAGNHNLIQDNIIQNSHHAALTVRDSDYNVIKGNYFSNLWEKNVNTNGSDLYGESGGQVGDHNLWEGNIFATTYFSVDSQPSPGIQMELSYNILRNNVFYENEGGGYRNEGYLATADRVINNRIYNNVYFQNNRFGIGYLRYESPTDLSGSVYKNNILYGNSPDQIFFDNFSSDLENTYFINNNIINSSSGQNVINHDTLGNHPLSWWQTNYSSNFSGNVEVDPQFVNTASYDFNLQSTSPMIDAGTSLTTTRSAGSGTVVPVVDSYYFTDGYGVITGDEIVVGSNSPVTITSIDYNNHNITVDSSISWNSGDSVNLEYAGSAPDMGAFEYGLGAVGTATPTPTATAAPSPLPGLSWEAEDGTISAPFTVSGGLVSQSINTQDPVSGGVATYLFNIDTAGDYVVQAGVDAAYDGSNSVFMAIDEFPSAASGHIWDILPYTTGVELRTASRRGSGTPEANEFDPMVFNLTTGLHTLYIVGREPDVYLDTVTVSSYGSTPTPTPTPTATPIVRQTFEAEDGTISAPFVSENGYIYHNASVIDPALGGEARYSFDIIQPGQFFFKASIKGEYDGADSIFVEIDAQPFGDEDIWDFPVTSGYEDRTMTQRGSGSIISPWLVDLAAGTHELIIRGREADVFLDNITIVRYTGPIQADLSFRLQGRGSGASSKAADISLYQGGSEQYSYASVNTTENSGIFEATISDFNEGTYSIYIKSPGYLRKLLSATSISTGDTVSLADPLQAGDFNSSNTITIDDIALMLSEYTSLTVTTDVSNEIYDVTGDGAISITDIATVLSNYTQLTISGD